MNQNRAWDLPVLLSKQGCELELFCENDTGLEGNYTGAKDHLKRIVSVRRLGDKGGGSHI